MSTVRNVLTPDRGSVTVVADPGGRDGKSTYASIPPKFGPATPGTESLAATAEDLAGAGLALNIATGEVTGKGYRRHRAVEFKKFLALIDKAVPETHDVHRVLDNYGTHKTAQLQNWLRRRPRYHLHFPPTRASWLNQVERWFAEITRRRIRRGTFRSTQALEAAIREHLQVYNEDPQPFIWTKSADDIPKSLNSYCKEISGELH